MTKPRQEREKEREREKGKESENEKEKERHAAASPMIYVPPPFAFTGEGCGMLGVLPREALLLILELVGPKDMASLPRVSREFQHLSGDEGLWRLFYFYHWKKVLLPQLRAENLYLLPPEEPPVEDINHFEKKNESLSWKDNMRNG